MIKFLYVCLVMLFVKSLIYFVGVYGGVFGVKVILGDFRGEIFICRYFMGFVDFKCFVFFIVWIVMDFVKIVLF